MPVLMNRREAQNGVISYFHLQWSRNIDIFTGPKIVVPYRTQINAFAYNDVEWFCRSDVYVITQKNKMFSLKYILSLLNSSLYFIWLYNRGKRKGEILELFQIPLSEIPIPDSTAEQQKVFVDLADKITDIKKSNPSADTSSLELQIDNMVYKLHGLSEAEIKIIENGDKV